MIPAVNVDPKVLKSRKRIVWTQVQEYEFYLMSDKDKERLAVEAVWESFGPVGRNLEKLTKNIDPVTP